MSEDLSRIPLFGIPFVSSQLQVAGEHLAGLASSTQKPILIAHSDVHVLTRALHEADYGAGLAHFDYICPDGMPIVWLLRSRKPDTQRLYGPDMMEKLWQCGHEHGLRHFLLGGTPEAQTLLKTQFAQRFKDVQVVGHYSPPMGTWPEGENEHISQLITHSQANCVWVSLGCPKQERWLFENRAILPPALYFAVGAAFNFHAGLVDQAPLWLRSHGFEWLYRLIKEPRRLMKRYCVHMSLFAWYCLTRKR